MANLKKAVTTKWIALGALCALSVVLLFAIYVAIMKPTTNKDPANYSECMKNKDALLRATYPEQCVVNGKSFINPNQLLQAQ